MNPNTPNIVKIFQCPYCDLLYLDRYSERIKCVHRGDHFIEHTYASVDALASDEAVLAGATGLRDAAGSSKLRDHYRLALSYALKALGGREPDDSGPFT